MLRRRSLLGFVLSLVSVVVLVPLRAGAYREVPVEDGGSIAGSVRFEGPVPSPSFLKITKFKEICKDVPNESLVVGPNGGLRYVVVTLEGIEEGKAIDRQAEHELDNLGCRFVPHVQALSVGQSLLLENNDPILHTAHALFKSGQPQFNVGLFPGKVTHKPMVSSGIVEVRCEVHPWMRAYVAVADHPYISVTDVYGDYLIGDIPPGTYRLKVWHETLGTQEKKVEVKKGATSRVDFGFAPTAGGK